MTGTDLTRHTEFFGKLAHAFDLAGASGGDQELLVATTADQVADGTILTIPGTQIFASYMTSWLNAIGSGPTSIQTLMKQIAGAYLVNATFTDTMTTVPTQNTPAAVLVAFATELTSVTTEATLTTKTTTGLVNFLDAISGISGSWPTAADGSATVKDSVVCVTAVI